MKTAFYVLFFVLAAAAVNPPALAQKASGGKSPEAMRGPTETGQAAFASIQEVVTLLEADPATDWSKVDIARLREHLVDMNNVTLYADVETEEVDSGAKFTATGDDAVEASIRRMVKEHAAAMNGTDGWTFEAEETSDGAVLTVTAEKPEDVTKIRALGFFGIMSRGMHHQMHHLMLATGTAMHH